MLVTTTAPQAEPQPVRAYVAALATIARFTLFEALRNRLLWLAVVLVIIGYAGSALIAQVAITDTSAYQAGLLSAFLRLGMVFTAALFVVTSMVREQQDKGLEIVLSMPIPRAAYLAGKQLGFVMLAVLLAALAGLALVPFTASAQASLWAASLACELVLVAALSLLFVVTFRQVTWGLSGVFGFYLVARSIAALQLIGHGPLANQHALSQRVINGVLDALAWVMPELHRFTPSDWVVHMSGSVAALAPIAAQSAIYLVLLMAAALFDFYRRNY